eukprot:5538007-Karenia_brevis.AAC.1
MKSRLKDLKAENEEIRQVNASHEQMLAALQQMQLQQMHQNEMMWQMMQGFMNQSYAVQMQSHQQNSALLGAVSSTVQ